MTVESMNERRIKRRHQLRSQVRVRDIHTSTILGQVANLHQEGIMLLGTELTVNASYQIALELPNSVNSQQSIVLGIECLWHQAMTADNKLFWSGCSIIDKTPAADQCIVSLIQRQAG